MSTVNGFQVGSETLKYNYESLDNYNTPNFSTSSSKTYAVGDYVMYNGKLYKCTTATTGGTWVDGNWTEAVLSDDVNGLSHQISDLKSTLEYEIDQTLVFEKSTSVTSGSWNTIQTGATLYQGTEYTIDAIFDIAVSGYFILETSNGVGLVQGRPNNTKRFTATYTPDANYSNVKFEISLNASVSPINFDCRILSGAIGTVSDRIISATNKAERGLQAASALFSTYGDANALPINRSFEIRDSDKTASNLPSNIVNESYSATISTIATDSTVIGAQFLIAREHIYSRIIRHNGSVVTSAETDWILIGDTGHMLTWNNSTFQAEGGDANRLPVNLAFVTDSRYVTDSSHLPVELANYPSNVPFTIITASSSANRGYQIIVAESDLYFRTISYNPSTKKVTTDTAFWGKVALSNEVKEAVAAIRFPCPYADYETFNTDVNGAFLAKALTTDRMDCTPSNIYAAHESNIYVYDDKIFLIYSANKTDGTEDHHKYNIELTITSLDGAIQSSTKVVAIGDTVLGKTIQGCQAAFILPDDDEIHIYCDLHVDDTKIKMYHIVYNITSGTFGSFSEVSYVDSAGATQVAYGTNEMYICPSWFSYSTHNNCTALFFNSDNVGVGYTDDYTTFAFLARVDAPLMGSGGEITAAYISEFEKFNIAYRTVDSVSYLIMRQYDISRSSWENELLIPDATARPMFFTFNGGIYLVNNAPYTRKNVSIWKYLSYLSGGVWSRMGVVEPIEVAKLNTPCTYFSFYVYNGTIYMASIMDNLTKITVSEIPLETVSNSQINSKLIELFS